MLPILAVDWRSLAVRDEEAERWHVRSLPAVSPPHGRHFRRQPSGLNILLSKHALCIRAETTSTPTLHNILILPNVV